MKSWASGPSLRPSNNPNHTTAPRGFSLSLLDNSPIPPLMNNRPPMSNLAQQQHPVTESTTPSNYYTDLIQQVTQWKMEMEQVRDDIYFLQIQNSQSLDALCMAGADIMPNDGAAAVSVGYEEDVTRD